MALSRLSELQTISPSNPITNEHKLVAITGSGSFGRNLQINLQELRAPGLPAGYKLAGYVETTGDCYIDTGVASAADVGIQMTYMFIDHPAASTPAVIIGAGSSNDSPPTRQWINDASDGTLVVGWGSSDSHGVRSQKNVIAYGQVNFMMSNTATMNFENAKDLQLGYDAHFSGLSLYLFANNSSKGTIERYYTRSKLYRCRLSKGRRVVRDFIPVIDDKDVYCLFETVEGKTYYSTGTALTGSPLASIWDYSHFNGVEGAYIDDYPTPDSPNFVKASGVEAGMKQIKDALMVGPMINVAYALSDEADRRTNFFFMDGLPLLQSATVPVPTETVPYPKNASGMLYLPNVYLNCRNAKLLQLFSHQNEFASSPLKIAHSVSWQPYARPYIGTPSTNYKSIYSKFYSTFNTIYGQSNSDYLWVYGPNVWNNNDGTNDVKLTNVSCRAIKTVSLAYDILGEYPFIAGRAELSNSSINIYMVPEAGAYNLSMVGEPVQASADVNFKNIHHKVYMPNAGHTTYASGTYRSGKTRFSIFADRLDRRGYSSFPKDIVYAIKYAGRGYLTDGITFKIAKKYFSVEESTEPQTPPSAITTAGKYYSTITKATPKDEVIIEYHVVTGTTGNLSDLVTTYTLKPNTDAEYGEDCKALREALWGTDNATSTGYFNGVVQVGPNKGSKYFDLNPSLNPAIMLIITEN